MNRVCDSTRALFWKRKLLIPIPFFQFNKNTHAQWCGNMQSLVSILGSHKMHLNSHCLQWQITGHSVRCQIPRHRANSSDKPLQTWDVCQLRIIYCINMTIACKTHMASAKHLSLQIYLHLLIMIFPNSSCVNSQVFTQRSLFHREIGKKMQLLKAGCVHVRAVRMVWNALCFQRKLTHL